MTLAAKINKDVTAVTSDNWSMGKRNISAYLKKPHKGAELMRFMELKNDTLVIDKDSLDRYGIRLIVV